MKFNELPIGGIFQGVWKDEKAKYAYVWEKIAVGFYKLIDCKVRNHHGEDQEQLSIGSIGELDDGSESRSIEECGFELVDPSEYPKYTLEI